MEIPAHRRSFKKQITFLVYGIFICGILFSLANIFFASEHDSPLHSVIFFNPDDSFMDLFHPISFASARDPYQFVDSGAIYPPICYILFRGFGLSLGAGISLSDPFSIREMQGGRIFTIIYMLGNVLPLCYILYKKYQGTEFTRVLFIIVTLFSGPYLFLIERGNILLFAFWLTFLFVLCHRSSVKWVKELSLIALALAAAMKIYPAIFGLLLIMNKQYKEAVRCAIYGILLFFVPFFFYNGLQTFSMFIQNILHGITVTTDTLYRVDWKTTISSAYQWIGLPVAMGRYHAGLLFIPAMLFVLLCGFLQKPLWKKCLAVTMVCVLLPSFSFYYMVVFYLIPLFLILQEHEQPRINFVYAGLLASSCILFMTAFGYHKQFVGFRFADLANSFTVWSVEFVKAIQIALLALLGMDTVLSVLWRVLKKKQAK